jgi:serine protease SohB
LAEYGIFLLETLTIVIAIIAIILTIVVAASKGGGDSKGALKLKKINDKYQNYKDALEAQLFDKKELKEKQKALKKEEKKLKKEKKQTSDKKPHLFVLSFSGDMHASQVTPLREEIDAILQVANAGDEVIVKLESPGGVVHGYGLAASQLLRIRDAGLKLTVSVDKVAASGGYMMAAVANQIVAAPFAVIGSIGVVMQLPNFNKLLKKNDIEIEQITAGEYKRTLTMLGENSDADREKVKHDLEEVHTLFKQWIINHRRQIDIEEVANGDIWFGQEAIDNKLVDKISTSDQLLLELSEQYELIEVTYEIKKSMASKIGFAAATAIEEKLLKAINVRPWF